MARQRTVKLKPTSDHPLPYDPEGDARAREPTSTLDELSVTSATAHATEFLKRKRPPPDMSQEDFDEEKRILKDALTSGKISPLAHHPVAARAVSSFLATYGSSLAMDVVQVRTALTNKLIELADCGDARYELKAIELLGKHSDISLFTERSEININYTTSEGLEQAIKERVKRLLSLTHVASEEMVFPDDDDDEEEIELASYVDVPPPAPAQDLAVWQEPPELCEGVEEDPDDSPDFDWSSPFDE